MSYDVVCFALEPDYSMYTEMNQLQSISDKSYRISDHLHNRLLIDLLCNNPFHKLPYKPNSLSSAVCTNSIRLMLYTVAFGVNPDTALLCLLVCLVTLM